MTMTDRPTTSAGLSAQPQITIAAILRWATVADLLTTAVGLPLGTIYEWNPLARLAMATVGVPLAMFAVLAYTWWYAGLLRRWDLAADPWSLRYFALLAAFKLAVPFWNVGQIYLGFRRTK